MQGEAMTSCFVCEDSEYKTVGLTSIHFDGNGVMELSEQGMNTLKYRIYADIARSHDE